MSLEYSLFPQSTVYVPRIWFMSRVQFMSSEYSLCPECSLCPQSTVYVLRVQFIEIIAYKVTKTKTVCIHGIYV